MLEPPESFPTIFTAEVASRLGQDPDLAAQGWRIPAQFGISAHAGFNLRFGHFMTEPSSYFCLSWARAVCWELEITFQIQFLTGKVSPAMPFQLGKKLNGNFRKTRW